jgi:hypothetical protein
MTPDLSFRRPVPPYARHNPLRTQDFGVRGVLCLRRNMALSRALLELNLMRSDFSSPRLAPRDNRKIHTCRFILLRAVLASELGPCWHSRCFRTERAIRVDKEDLFAVLRSSPCEKPCKQRPPLLHTHSLPLTRCRPSSALWHPSTSTDTSWTAQFRQSTTRSSRPDNSLRASSESAGMIFRTYTKQE